MGSFFLHLRSVLTLIAVAIRFRACLGIEKNPLDNNRLLQFDHLLNSFP